MKSNNHLFIIGTGSLARAICYAIPLLTKDELNVTVISRSLRSSKEVATVGNVRAKLVNSKVMFAFEEVDWENKQKLKETFIDAQAKIVLLASSLQSPWEFSDTKSSWATLIQHGGFGITLPLQAYLAIKLGFLFKEYSFSGLFINACYPDAVNPLLKSLGFNITCGVGNISIIHALLKTTLKLASNDKLKLLAHHFHVGSKTEEIPENHRIVGWINEKPFSTNNNLYSFITNINGAELNHITGCTAAQMLIALLRERFIDYHAPGPYGLPGGYPVTIGKLQVKLDLPKDLILEDAILKNQEWSILDGVMIDNANKIQFNSKATHLLSQYNFPYSNGFDATEIYDVCKSLLNLRDELRKIVSKNKEENII